MTIFNLIALLIAILIAVILVFFSVVWKLLDDIRGWQKLRYETLSDIRGDTVDIFQELNDIGDNIHDDLWNIHLAQKLGKISPNVSITPCYAPDGICTNPHRDCINCPKIGTGGSWSTSTNLNKEE